MRRFEITTLVEIPDEITKLTDLIQKMDIVGRVIKVQDVEDDDPDV